MTGPAGLVSWHPRDVDTLEEHYELVRQEQSMQAARARLAQQMGG